MFPYCRVLEPETTKQGMTGWSYSGWWALIRVGSCCDLCGDGGGAGKTTGEKVEEDGGSKL